MIVTFFSYKGGVGRSQLAANLAAFLCMYADKKVLLMDWDLEAPGIQYFFDVTIPEAKEGIIDLLEDYIRAFKSGNLNEEGDIPDFTADRHIVELLSRKKGEPGVVHLIPAGKIDAHYGKRINEFDWEEFYDQLDGKYFIEYLKLKLQKSDYDYVFIDSRTGNSDYSGICNIQLPDLNLFVIGPTEQNFRGCQTIADKIAQAPYIKNGLRELYILPVLSRLDRTDDTSGKWFGKFREDFKKHLENFLQVMFKKLGRKVEHIPENLLGEFIEHTLLEYKTGISYGEQILFKSSVSNFEHTSLEKQFREIACLIELFSEKKSKVLTDCSILRVMPTYLDPVKPVEKEIKLTKYLTNIPGTGQAKLIGREKELEKLTILVKENNAPVNVFGIRGIGKSILVKAFLTQQEKSFDHIAWIESKENITKSLIDDTVLKKQLGVGSPFEVHSNQQQFELIIHRLQNLEGRKLMVFEDASQDAEQLMSLLPPSSGWHLIFTSTTPLQGLNKLEVEGLKPKSAKTLFQHWYPEKLAQKDLNDFIRITSGHPLTVILGAKSLEKDFSLSIRDLLEALEYPGTDFNTVTVRHEDQDFKLQQYISTLYSLSDLEAQEVDNLIKFALLPDKALPGKEIIELFQIEKALQPALVESCRKLVEHGWLNETTKNKFQLHGFPRTVISQSLDLSLERARPLLAFLHKASHVGYEEVKLREKKKWIPYLKHLLQMFSKEEAAVITLLKGNLGRLVFFDGNYDSSIELLESAIQELAFPFEHTQILFETSARFWLVEFHRALGDAHLGKGFFSVAKQNYMTALELTQNKQNHTVLTVDLEPQKHWEPRLIRELGIINRHEGEFKNSERLIRYSISQFEELDGKNSFQVALSLNQLGLLYLQEKDSVKAIASLEEAVGITESNKATDKPDYLYQLSNLAAAYHRVGMMQKARAHIEKALPEIEKQFGKRNPEIAPVLNIYATILNKEGETAKAKNQLEKVISICEGLQEHHPNPLQAKLILGKIYLEEGRTLEGRDLLRFVAYAKITQLNEVIIQQAVKEFLSQ